MSETHFGSTGALPVLSILEAHSFLLWMFWNAALGYILTYSAKAFEGPVVGVSPQARYLSKYDTGVWRL